jgi:putative ABC transport system substrate-binding protein
MAGALPTKLLELLHELVPTATTITVLVNPNNANAEADTAAAQLAAHAIGVQTHAMRASTDNDLEAVFATTAQNGASALLVNADSYFLTRRDQIGALAVRYAIPTCHNQRDFVEAGGLMSYGASSTEMYHQVGVYAGRILKGEKPGELPVQQPTKFELVINLKTAKAIGLTIPESFLLRADEVIE